MTTETDRLRNAATPDAASEPSHRRDVATGHLVDLDGTISYTVEDVDRMPPFLMSIVSDGDRWMFLSTAGGLTAGRRDAALALFPYETDNRLHLLSGVNGPATAVRLHDGGPDDIWHPTLGRVTGRRRRTLSKSVVGDSVVFDEIDASTGLRFRYRWASGDRFGFIRTTTLVNEGDQRRAVDIVDGLRGILPHGLDPTMYLPMGNLANAYKRSELIDRDLRLAVYSLESLMSDQAEPAEALRATVAWSVGFEGADISLRPDAIRLFEAGRTDLGGDLVTGLPGAYFLTGTLELEPGEAATWHIVADVGLDQPGVASLETDLRSVDDPAVALESSIRETSHALTEIMARADALQCTGDEIATAHHFSNVTYNVMRGGIPMDGYEIDLGDFLHYLARRNVDVHARHRDTITALGPVVDRADLLATIARTGDVDLIRLGNDYLPFSFSRRHGDPSRPWNSFSIRVVGADGRPLNYYEGNWRDIFQNWEATAMSFPEYLPGMVSVFVNASTPDGFNPYRITSNGIDWEVPDPEDPWSNIGYWGDHQITYLLRLLEESDRYEPGSIAQLLPDRRFSYADVPYRIAPYDELLADPKSTIEFDEAAEGAVDERVRAVGADGRLVWSDGSVYHVTLAEKLVVPALAKLSNYVPGGGIWMNTQRPEWNDANNALVGYGLSMVTLYQLRRYLAYLPTLLARCDASEVEMSTEVAEWLEAITEVLRATSVEVDPSTADQARKHLVDELGMAFSRYRDQVYANGFSGTTTVPLSQVLDLCQSALPHLDGTIERAARSNGLFDSYNSMIASPDGAAIAVEPLGEMLEGQVAVIESGALDANGCADVVDALFESRMYRPDQGSFMLYPARELPSFLERNVVPADAVVGNALLQALLAASDTSVVVTDVEGIVRFSADLDSKASLEARLAALAREPSFRGLVDAHGPGVVRTYEDVFGHHYYTGRSGSMYGYEGIGSIYWHMVAKLLVAVQDATFRARAEGAPAETIERLIAGYERVRSGLGFNKTPAEHGAIPIDPYSHTPAHAGAQQPGLTGLVKEELLVRPAELGVTVVDGEIRFDPLFLQSDDVLGDERECTTLTLSLDSSVMDLAPGSLGLTICQVPIVITPGSASPDIEVEFADGTSERIEGTSLGRPISNQMFARSGEVTGVRARIPRREG